jgi:SAM-dependent methyltransferase
VETKGGASRVQDAFNTNYTGSQELNDTQENLANYSKSIVSKFYNFYANNVRVSDPRVLEFGAGSGFLASLWQNFDSKKPDCIEIDENLIAKLRASGYACETNIESFQSKFDYIYSSNVLEHIEDDVSVLIQLRKHTFEGGYLALYVPAHQFLYNQMDEKIGHYRRYGKKELKEKVTAAGWEIKSSQWDDFLGFFALGVLKFVGYKNKVGLGSPISLKVYDLLINPFSRSLDKAGTRFITGKNLLLFAHNPVRKSN